MKGLIMNETDDQRAEEVRAQALAYFMEAMRKTAQEEIRPYKKRIEQLEASLKLAHEDIRKLRERPAVVAPG